MHSHLSKQDLYRKMFLEEARIGSLLQDPNIAQIFDFVFEKDDYYLVMEWVEGIDLASYIRYSVEHAHTPIRWELVAAIGIGMLRGLSAAHERVCKDGRVEPIVHRDVSPHNVLIGIKGRAKLIDFGLSLALDRNMEDTDPGMAKGKLTYLAPEIARGERPSPLTDQFSAGTVLWETLVGERAFEEEDVYDTYVRVANAEVKPLQDLRPDIPLEFCELVHRSLSLDQNKRFSTIREMACGLGEILKSHRTTEDLYELLANAVEETRANLNIGHRTQDPLLEISVPFLNSGLVELMEEKEEDTQQGLRRWLPSFFRKSST